MPHTRRLGLVVVRREKLLLQLVKRRVRLLHESDPPLAAGLREDLLGDGDQASIATIADGAVAKGCVGGDGTQKHVSAGDVADVVRVVDADTAAEKEVDDPFFEDSGGGCSVASVRLDGGIFIAELRLRLGILLVLGFILGVFLLVGVFLLDVLGLIGLIVFLVITGTIR